MTSKGLGRSEPTVDQLDEELKEEQPEGQISSHMGQIEDPMDAEEEIKAAAMNVDAPEENISKHVKTIEQINREEHKLKQRPETAKFPLNTKVYNPHDSWRKMWDMLMICLLFFVALVTPYELAFVDDGEEGMFCKKFCFMFVLNTMIDIAFITDMGLNFNTAYFSFEYGIWVVDQRMIAKKYFGDWFFIDLVSIIPFHLIPAALGINEEEGNTESLAPVIRLIRLFRLLKLLRIARASRILDRLQNRISISFAAQALLKSAMITVTLCHWSACGIRLAGGNNRDLCRDKCSVRLLKQCLAHELPEQWPQKEYFYDDDNVTASKSMCYYRFQLQNFTDGTTSFQQYLPYANQSQIFLNTTVRITARSIARYCASRCQAQNWYDKWGFSDLDNPSQYIAAFYWGIYNLKGCDSFAVALSEYVVAILVMVLGGGVWMVLVADTCNVLGNLDVTGNEFRRNMDNLNSYLSKNHFHDRLKFKLRSYFNHCRSLFAQKFYKQTMNRMSPVLQGEVSNREHGAWVRTIMFFAKAPKKERRELIVDISMAFAPMVYVPNDFLSSPGAANKTMMVIQKGLAIYTDPPNLPRFLPASSVFGDDIILKTVTDKNKFRPWSVKAITYCDVYELTFRKLLIILTSGMFGDSYTFIRKHATRMLLRNAMPLALKEAMENPQVTTFHDVAMLMTGELEEVAVDVAQAVDFDDPGVPPEQMLALMDKFNNLESTFRKLGRRSQAAANSIRLVRAELYAFMKSRGLMGTRKGGLFQVDTTFTAKEGSQDQEERMLIPLAVWQEYWTGEASRFARISGTDLASTRVDAVEGQLDKLATFLAITRKNPNLLRDVSAMEEAINSIAKKQRAIVKRIKQEVSHFSLFKEQKGVEGPKQERRKHTAAWDA